MAAIEIHPLAEALPFGSRVTGLDRDALADKNILLQINCPSSDHLALMGA